MAFSIFGSKDKPKGDASSHTVQDIDLTAITPNRFQPRKNFDIKSIDELARTIQIHGLIQPIILREYETNKYEIIAGERRYRAVTALQWKTVPAIVQTIDDSQAASMALIENLQREELTSIEEAQAYQSLMTLNHLTQEALAQRIGKSQSFIANKLRLLKLSDVIQNALLDRSISERHARALVGLGESQQIQVLKTILNDNLTVRDTDKIIQELSNRAENQNNSENSTENSDITVNNPIERVEKNTDNNSKAKPKKTKAKIIESKDTRLALNTIKKSIKLVTETGIQIKSEEQDLDDVYRIVIEIPKNEKREKGK